MEYLVKIPYYDSGTKKKHHIEMEVKASSPEAAVSFAKKHFNEYEKYSSATWVRQIIEDKIEVREKKG